jgi:hypothetical protein
VNGEKTELTFHNYTLPHIKVVKPEMLKVEKEKIIREQNYFESPPLLTVIVLTKTVPVRSMISAG